MTGVVTGLGVIAPTGVGVAEHWRASLGGVCGIEPITTFDVSRSPVRLAGQVRGFDGPEHVENRLLVQTDRWTWMALAAGRLAFADAGLDPAEQDPSRMSVVTASGSGGNAFGQKEIQALWSRGPRAVSAYQSIGWFYAASTGQLSIRDQLKGACGVLVADSAGAVDAAAQALRLIRRGAQAVLTGATEAPLSPYALACQASQTALSGGTEPATAYRPFHPEASGFVPGEGGAMLVIEPAARAAARGARVYAELVATASTHDAYHPVDPPPDSRQLIRAIRLAIDRAELTPRGIDVVFADGVGERVWDGREADAIREVFGARRVPVTVPKTMTGRLCSGAAALDLAWAALTLAHSVIPPSVNLGDAARHHGLDLVTEAREHARLRTALVIARGTGGFNSVAVLTRPGER